MFDSWYQQHETLDRLNIQAHKNAIQTTDEYVMESFVTFEKVSSHSHASINICFLLVADGSVRPAHDWGLEGEDLPTVESWTYFELQLNSSIYGGKFEFQNFPMKFLIDLIILDSVDLPWSLSV